ncbi:MAG: VOC family protein [Chloroflexi bacterium]|nr:VOC family protein [Chloroflexota bacterium]
MKAIRHTGIVVSDLEPALRFYVDLLGLKVTKGMDETGDYIDTISGLKNVRVTTVKMAAGDGNLIELLYYHSHRPKSVRTREACEIGISHIAFTVGNVDAEYARLSKAGVPFNSPPQKSPDGYAKVTFCRDPDGTLIELVELLN